MKTKWYKFVKICVVGFFASLLLGIVAFPVWLLTPIFFIGMIVFLILHARSVPRDVRAKAKAEAAAQRAEYKKASAARKKAKAEDRRPVAAVVLSVQETRGRGVIGTAARGLVGFATFGVFGAGVGIASARSKVRTQSVTFSVRYASGRTGVETVRANSDRYRELAKLVVK